MGHLTSGIAFSCAVLAAGTVLADFPSVKDRIREAKQTAQVREIDAAAFLSSLIDPGVVKLSGIVRDIVDDELNAAYHFIVLDADRTTVYCPIADVAKGELTALIGAQVSIVGIRDVSNLTKGRRLFGCRLYVDSMDDITVLAPPPADPYDVNRAVDKGFTRSAADVHFLGRVRMKGRVLASWDRRRCLLRRDDGFLARIETIEDAPPANQSIEAAGSAETDLFNVNLMQAVWRPCELADTPENIQKPKAAVTAKAIMEDACGQRKITPDFFGRTIRLCGIVRNIQRTDDRLDVITVENDGYLIGIRVSNVEVAAPPLGSSIDVTGVCVFDIDNWHPNAPFPHVKGFFVVPRTAEDIVVVSLPPWWTPGKLLAVIGVLLAALSGFFVWNRMLRILVERRGRQLHREQLQAVRSELKFLERSSLAVELHDAISQYLTAIALELRTVDELAAGLADGARRHLSIASHTLASCRDELRNCLWDLRHNTLEINDLADAIRTTVAPHIGAARLMVRFDVARKSLSENAAHVVLQIVRELAANAVRHGHATEIRIAGKLEGNTLRFSVRDNGCGFSPDAAPGMEEGHFGLLGVRERAEKFEGTLEIESAPGRGTRITASISLENERI